MISLPEARKLGYSTEIKATKVGDFVNLELNAYNKNGSPKYTGLSVLSIDDAIELQGLLAAALQGAQ